MLKVRFDNKTGLLTGWAESQADVYWLVAREGESTAVLDIDRPGELVGELMVPCPDYEDFTFSDGKLIPTLAPLVRDWRAEIDGLKTRVEALEKE